MLKVSGFTQRFEDDGQRQVAARIGDFDLWFRFPSDWTLQLGGEALACASLLPAMRRGGVLELPPNAPVDPVLLGHLDQLQDIFLAWQDVLQLGLTRVRIEASLRDTPAASTSNLVSFLSGGVDGSYTAIRNRERIDHAVLLRGIDMQLENGTLWDQAHASTQRLADHFGLPLITVTSNIRFLGYHHGLKWARHYQGAGLATIGHLLGAREVLVAATSSLADLAPYGSHPMTDPLWSSATTRFVHEGAVPRTEKIRAIGADPVVMEVLRVCWHDSGYNCGRCGKCLRTMVALHLLGITAPTFPGAIDWKLVRRIRLGDPSEWAFFGALEKLEKERPDPQARAALEIIRRRSLLGSAAREVDTAFGYPVRQLIRRLRRDRS